MTTDNFHANLCLIYIEWEVVRQGAREQLHYEY